MSTTCWHFDSFTCHRWSVPISVECGLFRHTTSIIIIISIDWESVCLVTHFLSSVRTTLPLLFAPFNFISSVLCSSQLNATTENDTGAKFACQSVEESDEWSSASCAQLNDHIRQRPPRLRILFSGFSGCMQIGSSWPHISHRLTVGISAQCERASPPLASFSSPLAFHLLLSVACQLIAILEEANCWETEETLFLRKAKQASTDQWAPNTNLIVRFDLNVPAHADLHFLLFLPCTLLVLVNCTFSQVRNLCGPLALFNSEPICWSVWTLKLVHCTFFYHYNCNFFFFFFNCKRQRKLTFTAYQVSLDWLVTTREARKEDRLSTGRYNTVDRPSSAVPASVGRQ